MGADRRDEATWRRLEAQAGVETRSAQQTSAVAEPFPARATPFVPETPPAREILADSRTLKGGGAAGIATVGAAGVEVAQEVLAETQSAILPLVPYLDTLRWVFIAVALIGIAISIHARIDDWKRGHR
jgi:hypothetical protein